MRFFPAWIFVNKNQDPKGFQMMGKYLKRQRDRLPMLPCNVPSTIHQQMDVLDSSIVSIMQTFGKVLLHVRLKVLIWFFTLKYK